MSDKPTDVEALQWEKARPLYVGYFATHPAAPSGVLVAADRLAAALRAAHERAEKAEEALREVGRVFNAAWRDADIAYGRLHDAFDAAIAQQAPTTIAAARTDTTGAANE